MSSRYDRLKMGIPYKEWTDISSKAKLYATGILVSDTFKLVQPFKDSKVYVIILLPEVAECLDLKH